MRNLESFSKGYVESIGSTKRRSKEDIRVDQLIPSEILADTEDGGSKQRGIKQLLDAYYRFNNMDEFIYTDTDTLEDIVINGVATFRISDPDNTNDEFFTDDQFSESTLKDADGNNISISSSNVFISNGNNLPGSLAEATSPIGKTIRISGLAAYNNLKVTLTTPIKYWVGPGPSYILNSIEDAMNIDHASEDYLAMIQREIAAAIPKNLTVNKRTLYKRIVDYYKIRGSADSIETFFRLLFNDTVEVEYPYESTLIPSSGNWDESQDRYLDHKGFVSDNIKIHDSYFYQKFSYVIKSAHNISEWKDTFSKLVHPSGFIFFGEILIITDLVRKALGDSIKNTNGVYPRTGRFTLSSMPGEQPGLIGAEDLPVLVEMFASMFMPTFAAKIDKSAYLSTTSTAGVVTSIEVADGGYGYQTVPAITIVDATGGSGAAATAVLDEHGQIESITIDNGGSGYTNAFATVAANPLAGQLEEVYLRNLANKIYKIAPIITFDAPTSKGEDGLPLATNITATAEVILDSEGEITGINITEPGFGYVLDPKVKVSSSTSNEYRAKDMRPVLILALNHLDNLSRTIPSNGYFARKGTGTFESEKLFNGGYPIYKFNGQTIESINANSINNSNTSSFIYIE
jgi:hypothetical protein